MKKLIKWLTRLDVAMTMIFIVAISLIMYLYFKGTEQAYFGILFVFIIYNVIVLSVGSKINRRTKRSRDNFLEARNEMIESFNNLNNNLKEYYNLKREVKNNMKKKTIIKNRN